MLLLDTCALLWLTSDQTKLSPAACQALSAQAGQLYVSAVSGFEIAQKAAKGKLRLPLSPSEWMALASACTASKLSPWTWTAPWRPGHCLPCTRTFLIAYLSPAR